MKQKKYIILLIIFSIVLCNFSETAVFAAQPTNDNSNELRIVDFTLQPQDDNSRMTKGHNYNFKIVNDLGLLATVSGTVIFDYRDGKATVVSAGTPKVTDMGSGMTITASAAGSTEGSTAVVTVTTKVSQLVFSKTIVCKIKCSGNGQIWEEQ